MEQPSLVNASTLLVEQEDGLFWSGPNSFGERSVTLDVLDVRVSSEAEKPIGKLRVIRN